MNNNILEKRILVIGNGFDIAHNLPTSYLDFIKICKKLYDGKKNYKDLVSIIEDSMPKLPIWDVEMIDNFCQSIINNSWCYYYCNCEAEINGWIDFEREIFPVLEMFYSFFEAEDEAETGAINDSKYVSFNAKNSKIARTALLWNKYVNVRFFKINTSIKIEDEYSSIQYGILKEKMLDDLFQEFANFINIYKQYLLLFVEPIEIEKKQHILDINPDSILSFNYTSTEEKYFKVPSLHIHGKISEEKNNLVLGVNDVQVDEKEFIRYTKYYQRLKNNITGEKLLFNRLEYILTIYGHSLDITDEDILKPLLEGAHTIEVYYYREKDREQKLLNLIVLLGREKVEKLKNSDRLLFLDTSERS